MTVLVRKITKGKWKLADPTAVDRISADTITSELRTHHTTLSFWACASAGDDDLASAMLALAAAEQGSLENVDLLWLPVPRIESAGLAIRSTAGATPIQRLVATHRDVVISDYAGLGVIAGIFADAFRQNQCVRFRREQICQMLVHAVDAGDVALDGLSTKVRQSIQGAFPGQ